MTKRKEPVNSKAVPRTELRNQRTIGIDKWPTERVIQAILAEDARGVESAQREYRQLAFAVDLALEKLKVGGKIHSFGAGASGRLAILDSTEMRPTFGVPKDLFSAHFPGGIGAVVDPTVDLEDQESLGYIDAACLKPRDVFVGVTASGVTPYVLGALRRAKMLGSLTVVLTCDSRATAFHGADVLVIADTGPEAITGSTRLKAGTATKVLLNAFSTTLMVRMGRTYSNLMSDVVVTNKKLTNRAAATVAMATGISEIEAAEYVNRASGVVPLALVHALTEKPIDVCQAALTRAGTVKGALEELEVEG